MLDDYDIWSMAQAPDDPDTIVVGTQPANIFVSTDGGKSFAPTKGSFADACIFVGKPRVTQILFDPIDKDTLWAGVEIDGVHRSTDRGRTWKKVGQGINSEDIHGVAVDQRNGGKLVYATTNRGLNVSRDNGETFAFQELDSPWQYTRTIVPRADGDATVFLTNGNGPPGSTGRLLRSRDHGATGGREAAGRAQLDAVDGGDASLEPEADLRLLQPRPALPLDRRRRELDQARARIRRGAQHDLAGARLTGHSTA